MVGRVSQSWCARCRFWTKGPKEHTTATYVIPLSRSIHYAEQGIHFQSQDLKLAPFYANSLHNWKAEPLRLFTIFRHYLSQIITTLT
jgi:hypothetical protein